MVKMTNWHYFIQSSFTLHSLHFELLYHLFLRQSSITVHVRRFTHLLFMTHDALFIVRKASPEGYLFEASGVTKGRKITS